MKTGALIIASGDYGEGQQDNEGIPVFLPMYPLDGTTVIKGEIAKLRKAKISPILVLTGCHCETLKLHLSHNNVIIIEAVSYTHLLSILCRRIKIFQPNGKLILVVIGKRFRKNIYIQLAI